MSLTLNLGKNNLFSAIQSNPSMLKSTQEKLQRQADRDNKVAFFEAQKENLKNMQSLDLDDIARKIELLHSYNDQIAAAKKEYNSSQMLHIMDEAEERGEQIKEAEEKNKPKTEEERKEDAIKEANKEASGTDESDGLLSELLSSDESDGLPSELLSSENMEEYNSTQKIEQQAEINRKYEHFDKKV